MFHKIRRTSYIFTNKRTPKRGIMSAILGMISIVSIIMSIYLTYQNKGMALMQYGAVIILSIIYATAGISLGILSYREQDIYKLFPIAGLVLNIITFVAGIAILCLGIM